jgi:hypothetical protein
MPIDFRMLEAVPLLAVTLVFLSVFVYSIASVELNDVRTNWNARRCEPVVMAMAQMVPEDDSVNRSDFATENFQFCMGRVIDSVLGLFFAPVLKIFDAQLNTTNKVKDVVNAMNESAASLMSPLTSVFSTLMNKIKGIAFQVIRIFYKMNSAFDRVMAIAAASVFAGASMAKAINNTINYVIKAILVILTVLIILTIFLWFVLFPYIPVILTTIGILSATVAGASAASMAGSFCVIPGTLVGLENDVWKRVEELQPGDILESGAKVEGILQTTGEGASLVQIDGVVLSNSHLVFDPVKGLWMPAGEHSSAEKTSATVATLYCLNTTDRCWKVRCSPTAPILQIRDWEELPPETDIYHAHWEAMVYEMLNRQAIHNTAGFSVPGRGLLGPKTMVFEESKGLIPVSEVQIGDYVKDMNYFTKVIGVYRDTSQFVPMSGPNGSIWMFYEGKRVWRHPDQETLGTMYSKEGYQIITKSGSFYANNLRVRDFTEIGYDRMDRTYANVLATLNQENNFEEER